MNSPRGPAAPNDLQTEEAKEGVRDDNASAARRRRARMMLMAATSGDFEQLRREEILPPAPHELVIDVSVAESPALERAGVAEEAATVAGGDS